MSINSIRLACEKCDRDDFDGVDELPTDWEDICEALITGNGSEWWTHIGLCPECQLTQGEGECLN